ncbi:MAG: hypothetical protein ACYS8W_04415 [Planctomycetota bacterium]|jgi:hypothetical protein
MSIFAKLFGRKRPEDENSDDSRPVSGEIIDEDTEVNNPPAEMVARENMATKVSEAFGNISELLKTINEELVAQRESARTFKDTASAQIELMGTLGQKVEKQNEAHNALINALIDLPENLKKIPENAEQQTQVLKEMNESIQARGVEMHSSFERVNMVLEEMPKNAKLQLENLERINQRFEILESFNDTLSKICEAAQSQAKSISAMEENTERSLKYVSEIKCETIRQGRRSAILLGAILFLVFVFGVFGVIGVAQLIAH